MCSAVCWPREDGLVPRRLEEPFRRITRSQCSFSKQDMHEMYQAEVYLNFKGVVHNGVLCGNHHAIEQLCLKRNRDDGVGR